MDVTLAAPLDIYMITSKNVLKTIIFQFINISSPATKNAAIHKLPFISVIIQEPDHVNLHVH